MFPKVLLFRATNWFSKFIGWQTDSQYSHVALMFEDCVVESMQGYGVRKVDAQQLDWSRIDTYEIPGMTEAAAIAARKFLENEIGQGYDYWGALRFISRRRLPKNDKWFCSELVFAALEAAGIPPLERIDPQQVSPGLISYSPLLIRAGNPN